MANYQRFNNAQAYTSTVSNFQNAEARKATFDDIQRKINLILLSDDPIGALTQTSNSHLDRHMKNNDSAVLNRVIKPGSTTTANSTFQDKETMENTIIDALQASSTRIALWAARAKPGDNYEIQFQAANVIGHGYTLDRRTQKVKEVTSSALHMVLERDDSETGFSIITAFPDCDTRRTITQPTGRDLRSLLEGTWAYRDGTENERLKMLYEVTPGDEPYNEWLERHKAPQANTVSYETINRETVTQKPQSEWPENWNKYKTTETTERTPRQQNNHAEQRPQTQRTMRSLGSLSELANMVEFNTETNLNTMESEQPE